MTGPWPRLLRAARGSCLAYAVAWPALHLLLWLGVAGAAATGGVGGASGASSAADALVAVASLLAIGAVGVLALAWALRLWRARERAARRRAAAWCAGLALAYGAIFLHAWIAGPGHQPTPETWIEDAVGGLGAALVVGATVVGLPLALFAEDNAPVGAALYVAALLGGAALTLALPPPPPPTAPAHDAPRPPV